MKLFARFCDQVAVTLTDNSVWVKLCENDLIWKQSYFKLICARKWRRTQLEARSNNWICKLTSWWACLVFMLMLYTTSLQISYMILENMPFSIAWQQKKNKNRKNKLLRTSNSQAMNFQSSLHLHASSRNFARFSKARFDHLQIVLRFHEDRLDRFCCQSNFLFLFCLHFLALVKVASVLS